MSANGRCEREREGACKHTLESNDTLLHFGAIVGGVAPKISRRVATSPETEERTDRAGASSLRFRGTTRYVHFLSPPIHLHLVRPRLLADTSSQRVYYSRYSRRAFSLNVTSIRAARVTSFNGKARLRRRRCMLPIEQKAVLKRRQVNRGRWADALRRNTRRFTRNMCWFVHVIPICDLNTRCGFAKIIRVMSATRRQGLFKQTDSLSDRRQSAAPLRHRNFDMFINNYGRGR